LSQQMRSTLNLQPPGNHTFTHLKQKKKAKEMRDFSQKESMKELFGDDEN